MPASGGKARISSDDSFFCCHFFSKKISNINRIIAKL